jgi:hypothetical protein
MSFQSLNRLVNIISVMKTVITIVTGKIASIQTHVFCLDFNTLSPYPLLQYKIFTKIKISIKTPLLHLRVCFTIILSVTILNAFWHAMQTQNNGTINTPIVFLFIHIVHKSLDMPLLTELYCQISNTKTLALYCFSSIIIQLWNNE